MPGHPYTHSLEQRASHMRSPSTGSRSQQWSLSETLAPFRLDCHAPCHTWVAYDGIFATCDSLHTINDGQCLYMSLTNIYNQNQSNVGEESLRVWRGQWTSSRVDTFPWWLRALEWRVPSLDKSLLPSWIYKAFRWGSRPWIPTTELKRRGRLLHDLMRTLEWIAARQESGGSSFREWWYHFAKVLDGDHHILWSNFLRVL